MKKRIFFVFIGVFLVLTCLPILINYLMTVGSAVTSNDWIGFFGSYVGAIIGALVAVMVSNLQAKNARKDILEQIEVQETQHKEQINNQKELHKIENRSFIDYTMFESDLLLPDVDAENSFILLHHKILQFRRHNDRNTLLKCQASFIKLDLYGKSDDVLDLRIHIFLYDSEEEDDLYEAGVFKNGLKKNQSIFIPLYLSSQRDTKGLTKLIAYYTTIVGEKMKFESDLLNRRESYYVIDNEVENLIYEREMNQEFYILPGDPSYR
ncbi:hypothetical protein FZC83_05450 [Rossellomorea marisflavi]|uniref:Uncharacterized protein n=1 Tax=Rossellomorea marisflavi TaxID=189381 RepID=A0A5D4S237_9BACI|nr:hypothetical protein [Rossellomorea marisflavi]TYS57009.1 hypothetical protein FZC83_05450 [Rossellomorea marisflavi]